MLRGVGLTVTLCSGNTDTLGLEETLDLGVTLLHWASRRRWTSGVTLLRWASGAPLYCYAATLGSSWRRGTSGYCCTAMLGSSRGRWDLGALLRWGLEGTWDLGLLLHCYAGPRGHRCTAMLLRWGPRGDVGPRGTAALLRWGPQGDAGTSGHCYTATLGSRGDMGPRGTAALPRWRSSRRCWHLGDTATLGASMDLGGDAAMLGSSWRRGTSGYCYTAMATLAGASRGRWTSGHCYTGGLNGPRGTAALGGLEETLVPLGLVWTLVPLGSEETMDLGRPL